MWAPSGNPVAVKDSRVPRLLHGIKTVAVIGPEIGIVIPRRFFYRRYYCDVGGPSRK